jgi:hypothetical protein
LNIAKHCFKSSTRCCFLIDCEHARHPICTQLSHVQISMHNMISLESQPLSYLNLHFTIIQNYLVDFFDVFIGNSLFPLRASSSMLIFYWLSPNNVYQAKPRLQQYFFRQKATSLTHEIPSFHNKQKLFHSQCYISRTSLVNELFRKLL